MLTRRTPLKRGKPLRRSAFKRRAPKPRAGADSAHLTIIRSLPCAVCGTRRTVQPHHTTVERGLSRKSPDSEAMPLCDRDHRDFHRAQGFFAGWTKDARRTWQREQSERYRQLFDFPVVLLVSRVTRWEVVSAYATEEEAQKVWEANLRPALAWWGDRAEAARLLADPSYQPRAREGAA